MKYIWMIFLLVIVSGSVFAEGPVYNFNFGNQGDSLEQKPIVQKKSDSREVGDIFNYPRLGLQLGLSKVASGSSHDIAGSTLDLRNMLTSELVLSYLFTEQFAIRFGYIESMVSETDTEYLSQVGKGGLFGVEYRHKKSKWFQFILGLDFSYMHAGEGRLGSLDYTYDKIERIQFMTRMGPQLTLGKFFINGLLTVSWTKTNINYNYERKWSNESELSTGGSLNLGFMI